ncbi:MAG TPA: tetratricopeptide repeat protein [Candidatus Polarisedimenticolaceae bacterium]|nr:tetratricopeptide repeat protein [Candidatus Polarisedimenticolaceae bacterium]
MTEGTEPTRVNFDSMRRLAPGSRLAGRYVVGELRGVGGMGLVYKAHDEQLGMDVAVKVLRPELAADPSVIDRFRRELILGRQVSHPHVVRIHDIGQDGELYFLTMDYVDGCSLRPWLEERGRLDEATAIDLLRPIAQALAAAHRAGVVHRDLKPSNILIDASGRPHISDFGLARSLAGSGLTQTGAVLGTLDYLSPEQAKGEHVDARSDLYSLGIIAFEMLSGELPFPGGSFAETVAQRIAGRPRELAELGVQVSPRMRSVLRRCLEPVPARRFGSAEELLTALDQPEPSRLWARARSAIAVAGVALALTAALVFVLRRDARAPARSVSLAVLPFRDETGAPTLAWMSTGIPEMLADVLAQTPTLRVVDAGRVVRTLRDLKLDQGPWTEETLRRVGELLDAELLVVGSARARGPLLRVDAELIRARPGGDAAASPIAVEADSPGALVQGVGRDLRLRLDVPAPRSVAPVSDSPEALAAFDRAREFLARGDAVLAEPELERAVAADPGFGAAWYRLAEACEATGKRERAVDAADRAVSALAGSDRLAALAQARQASLRGDPERAQQILQQLVDRFPGDVDTAVALAVAYGQSGQLTEARQLLERVVAQAPNHPTGWFLLGKYSILAGESRKAVDDYLVRALVVNNNLRSQQGRADVLNAFGVAYRELGELERAQEKYAEAAELRREIGDQRGYATCLRNLAQLETAAGKHDAAARTLASALTIFDSLADRAGRADAVNDLGVNEEARGDYRRALEHYREALQIRRELGDRRAQAESLNNVGYANQLVGDSDNAAAYWRQALDLYRETGNREGEILVTQSLGQLQLAQGQWDDAVKSYLAALEQSREIELRSASAVSLGYLGRLAQYQGRYAAALASYDEALQVLDILKDARGLAEFTLARAETWIELGLLDEAQRDLKGAEAWLGEGGNHEQRAEWLRLDARIRSRHGDLAGARTALLRARSEASASQSPTALLRVEVEQGRQLLGERKVREAARALQDALARAERLGDAWLRLAAGEALARASLEAKDPARAERLLGQGLRLAGNCGSYAGVVRLLRLQAEAARARGDERAAQAELDRATGELKRIQQGLEPARASALERALAQEGT